MNNAFIPPGAIVGTVGTVGTVGIAGIVGTVTVGIGDRMNIQQGMKQQPKNASIPEISKWLEDLFLRNVY